MKNKKNIVIGLAVIIILAVVALFASGKKAKAQAKTTAASQATYRRDRSMVGPPLPSRSGQG